MMDHQAGLWMRAERPPLYSQVVADSPDPGDAQERALHILASAMGVAAELGLDLELSWSQLREIFGRVVFERAERRHPSAPKVASALQTSLRTVKEYRHRRREAEEGERAEYNVRGRVLEILGDGPADLAELEHRLPTASDVNYATNALASLMAEGLVEQETRGGKYRLTDHHMVPWYLRTEEHPRAMYERFFRHFSRVVASRVSRSPERAGRPGTMVSMGLNIPEGDVDEYMDELVRVVDAFDKRWEARAKAASEEGKTTVLVGGALAFGHLGDAAEPQALPDLAKGDARHVAFDDETAPTYRRYVDRDNGSADDA